MAISCRTWSITWALSPEKRPASNLRVKKQTWSDDVFASWFRSLPAVHDTAVLQVCCPDVREFDVVVVVEETAPSLALATAARPLPFASARSFAFAIKVEVEVPLTVEVEGQTASPPKGPQR